MLEGFGSSNVENKKSILVSTEVEIPASAQAAMQNSALAQIQTKAGPTLPIIRGRDRGLPKTPPIFDPEILRAKNAALGLKLKLKV